MYSTDELFLRLLECYFGVYLLSCFATREKHYKNPLFFVPRVNALFPTYSPPSIYLASRLFLFFTFCTYYSDITKTVIDIYLIWYIMGVGFDEPKNWLQPFVISHNDIRACDVVAGWNNCGHIWCFFAIKMSEKPMNTNFNGSTSFTFKRLRKRDRQLQKTVQIAKAL